MSVVSKGSAPTYLPCGACKGSGRIEDPVGFKPMGKAGPTLHAGYSCPTCLGSGFSDHIRRECPHCGELVRPNLKFEEYGRSLWHPACLEDAMEPVPDTGAALTAIKRSTVILEALRGKLGDVLRRIDNFDMTGSEWDKPMQTLGNDTFACLEAVDAVLNLLRRV